MQHHHSSNGTGTDEQKSAGVPEESIRVTVMADALRDAFFDWRESRKPHTT